MSEIDVHDDQRQITRRDLAEGRIEKVATDRTAEVAVSATGGVSYENVLQMADTAKLLSTAGPMLPPWLQGNVGGMFAICMRAQELGVSPLALANWTYLVENKGVQRVGYESAFFRALLDARAPLKKRPEYEIVGEGNDRRCRITFHIRGEEQPRTYAGETLGKLRPARNESGSIKGSPLWDRKPDLQLAYDASRDLMRLYFPELVSGIFGRDEVEGTEIEQPPLPQAPAVPSLRARLNGTRDEGFRHGKVEQEIEASLAAARGAEAPAPTKRRRKGDDDEQQAQATTTDAPPPGPSETVATEAEPIAPGDASTGDGGSSGSA